MSVSRGAIMERSIHQALQLAAIIKERRKKLNRAQAELAGLLGVSQGRYSQLESDPGQLSLERVLVALRSLGLELIVRDALHRDTTDLPVSSPALTVATTSLKVSDNVIEPVKRAPDPSSKVSPKAMEPIRREPRLGAITTNLPRSASLSENLPPARSQPSDKDQGVEW